MLIFNLIVAIFTLILQIINTSSITKTIKSRDTFMYLKLIPNDFVFTTTKPYKRKILMYNRIFLIITVIVIPFFIFFNNSSALLAVFIIIFLIIPFFFNQAIISKYIEELKKLDIAHNEQDVEAKFFGMLCFDNTCSHLYRYGHQRFIINTAPLKGKLLATGLVGGIIILLTVLIIFINPINPVPKVNSTLTGSELIFSYDKKKTILNRKNITEVTKINDLPKIIKNIDGINEDKKAVGVFDLEDIENATVYAKRNSDILLKFKAGDKYYIYSDGNKKNLEKMYEEIFNEIKNRKIEN